MNLPTLPGDTAEYGVAPLVALGLGIPAILGATYVGYKAIVPATHKAAENLTKPVNQIIYVMAGLAVLYFLHKNKTKRA